MAKNTRYISEARKDEKRQSDFSNMSVIIPVAGMGKRMKSYGPKCMIKINGVSLLERQIKQINKNYPKCDIILVVGFRSDIIQSSIRKKYNVRIIHNHDYENTNVAYSIYLGIQASPFNNCLIVYGDLIFNANAIRDLYGKESIVVIDDHNRMKSEEVGVMHYGNQVTNLSYALDDKWCQIAFLSDKELKLFEAIAGREESARWFGYEVLNKVIDAGGSLVPHIPSGLRIFEIDSPKDIKKVQAMGASIT